MTCREFIDVLHDYLTGELPADQAAQFQQHIKDCPSCVAYLDTYRKTIEIGAACTNLDDEGPPPDMPDVLVQAILKTRKKDD